MLCCFRHEGLVTPDNVGAFVLSSKRWGDLAGLPSGRPASSSTLDQLVSVGSDRASMKAPKLGPPPGCDEIVAAIGDKYRLHTVMFSGVIGDTPSEYVEPVSDSIFHLPPCHDANTSMLAFPRASACGVVRTYTRASVW